MAFPPIKLRTAFRVFVAISLVGLISLSLGVLLYNFSVESRQRAAQLRADFVEQQKQSVRREVERFAERVEYRKSVLPVSARERSRLRVEQGHIVASNIHDYDSARLSGDEIKEQILRSLRAIRFDDNIGYFFVVDLQGTVIMHALRPELEGRRASTLRDSRGRPFIGTLLEQVRVGGEGAVTYTFTKPGMPGNDFLKVTYAKRFDAYGWMIGTGVYLDDLEHQEKRELLAEITQVRYGKNGYLFVDDWNGLVLAHGAQPELVGTNIWDFEDSNGVKVVQQLIAAARQDDGDFVYYAWRKPDSEQERPKVSFATGIPDWRWMIGSGLYTDDVEQDIALMQQSLNRHLRDGIVRIVLGGAFLGLLLFLFVDRFYRWLMIDFGRFQAFFDQAAVSDLPMQESALRFRELQQQARYANRMLEDKINARKKLEDYQAHLQDLVAERTRGLEEQTRALALARDQADAANRAKSAFLANMSHELRTPLNAVLGFTRLMHRDAAVPSRHRENLAVVDRSGEHLLGLINNILDMAKVESGRIDVRAEVFDVRAMLDDLLILTKPRADAKALTLSLERGPNLPRFLQADASKLRQIIMNLLGNALKFTDLGGVRIGADCATDRHGRLFLEITVNDTGRGIPQADLQAVFEPFRQVGIAEGEGTGLGLSISRRLVELLGGDIAVCSSTGQGTTFGLSIPVERTGPIMRAGDPPPVIGLAPGQPPQRHLIVEDNPANRRLLRSLLEGVGIEVHEAVDGLSGLETFVSLRPSVVWMDLRMPNMDGVEAAAAIRRSDGGGDCRIIAVTASVFRDEQERLLKSGFDGFMRKPYREEELMRRLEQVVGLRLLRANAPQLDGDSPAPVPDPAELPRNWVTEFLDAVRIGHVNKMHRSLDHIGQSLPAQADYLRALTNAYDFERLTEHLQTALGDTQKETAS
ncbi:MAG: cache domain-containing protein [Thiohalocapsa sp.]|nr:cache domain-containing protein [Thiohalocapsa sp.]MCF7991091.1 cache domain-containing protein [Thiohalocapsa sp.]